MKVILYMAISADGYIAEEDDKTPWSEEEWKNFITKASEIGNVLIGRRTYELMKNDRTLDLLPCSLIMVLTSKNKKVVKGKVIFVNSLSQAVNEAKKRGFEKLIVAGGSKTNATALRSNKIDEIYLDIEPWLLGKGLPLFSSFSKKFPLKLLEIKRYGRNGIQLHYQIER